MDYDQIKPNSHRYKEAQKQKQEEEIAKREGVAQGHIMQKKRPLRDVLLASDMGDVKSYLIADVIIPAAQNLLEDIITNGAHMLIRGTTAPPKDARGRSGGYIQYGRYSDRGQATRRPTIEQQREKFDLDAIIFYDKESALRVLAELDEIAADYPLVKVSDVYDQANLTPPPQATRYGWTDTRSFDIISDRARDKDGWYDIWRLRLPKPMAID